MADWYRSMFPHAENDQENVELYSLRTRLGEWIIGTPISTFRFRPIRRKNDFFLFWPECDESILHSHCVFECIKAVAAHRTGLATWDRSDVRASDYLADWKRRPSKHLLFNFIDHWIQDNPSGSLREMVDYFEHEDMHLIDRLNISGFLKEMIVTGQLSTLPCGSMVPSELGQVVDLAKKYGLRMGGEAANEG